MMQERDEEKAQRMTTQKAEAQAILQYQLARAECERLKDRLKQSVPHFHNMCTLLWHLLQIGGTGSQTIKVWIYL